MTEDELRRTLILQLIFGAGLTKTKAERVVDEWLLPPIKEWHTQFERRVKDE